jgi:hypothetical protein
VTSVPVPARLTDAFVDGDVDLRTELQSEYGRRGEGMTSTLPLLAPHATSQHRTLLVGHISRRIPKDLTAVQPQLRADEDITCCEAGASPYSSSRSTCAARVVGLRVGCIKTVMRRVRIEVVN